MKETCNRKPSIPPRGLSLLMCLLAGGLQASSEGNGQGQEPAMPDKSRYHLFNPTPLEYMREMSTDRPDKKESAYTVDAGHFQFETDLVSYTRERDRSGGGDMRTDAYAIAPVNLKLGLLNNVDLQIVLDTYNRVRVNDRVAGTVQN